MDIDVIYNIKNFTTGFLSDFLPYFAYALSIFVFERENWKPQCNLTWLEATGRAKTNKLITYLEQQQM